MSNGPAGQAWREDEPLLECSVEDYQALRYSDDPIEAFNLFIKLWVSPTYHAHLLDNDQNAGQFVRDHIARAIDPSPGT